MAAKETQGLQTWVFFLFRLINTPMSKYDNAYVVVIARTIDILLCGWIWRDYDITISSMTGLELRKPSPARWARILGGFLNWIQTNHCELAIAADLNRCSQAIAILEQKAQP